jgi:hypothetical protein
MLHVQCGDRKGANRQDMARRTKRSSRSRPASKTKVIDLEAEEVVEEAVQAVKAEAKPEDDATGQAARDESEPGATNVAGEDGKPADEPAADAGSGSEDEKPASDDGRPFGAETKPVADSAEPSEGESVGSTGESAAAPHASPADMAQDSSGRSMRLAAGLAALLVAGGAGAWLYSTYGGGAGGGDLSAINSQVSAVSQSVQSNSAQLEKLQQALAGRDKQITELKEALQAQRLAVTDQTSSMREAIDEIRAAMSSAGEGSAAGQASMKLRLDDFEKRLDMMGTRVAKAEEGLRVVGNRAGGAEVDALKANIEALSKSLEAMRAEQAARQTQTVSALGQGFAKLSSKVESGAPFAAELDALVAVAPTLPGIVALRGAAESGVTSQAALADMLDTIAKDVEAKMAVAAEAKKEKGGVMALVSAKLNQVVKIRKVGEIDWPVELRAAAAKVREGDLPGVVQAMSGIEGTLPDGLADWIAQARARLAIDEALRKLSGAVLSQLAATGSNG